MRRLLTALDHRTKLMYILFLFWVTFWLLNGAEKFFDPERPPGGEVIEYVEQLGLSERFGLTALYAIGALEVLIGTTFLFLLMWSVSSSPRTGGFWTLFEDRTIHRLAFKAGNGFDTPHLAGRARRLLARLPVVCQITLLRGRDLPFEAFGST